MALARQALLLQFSITNFLLILQPHEPLLEIQCPSTYEYLGSKGVQRRWRTRVGLGPHGGVHRPQVLHSDHEPFTAMGGVVECHIVKTGGLNGKRRLQGHRVPGIATAWLPTLTMLPVGHSQTQLWMS